MVDEREAAVDAAPPAAPSALDWDAADATEGPTDANLGADMLYGVGALPASAARRGRMSEPPAIRLENV